MPSISYKYLEKLRKEISDLDAWLAGTEAKEDGSANPEDLKTLYTRVYAIHQKSIALHQAVVDEASPEDDFEMLRQDVAKLDYWLATEVSQPNLDEKRDIFTRVNAISLKALSIYRAAGQQSDDPQEPADDEPASLSRG
jgi:hypothetical protein